MKKAKGKRKKRGKDNVYGVWQRNIKIRKIFEKQVFISFFLQAFSIRSALKGKFKWLLISGTFN